MHIKYLAHSSFLLTASDGTRVLFDPYEAGAYNGAMKYAPITETVDVVVNSHGHADHADVKSLPGHPVAVDGLQLAKAGPRAVKSVSLRAVHTFHDPNRGRDRGENAMTILQVDGLKVCHCGDLGHVLSDAQVRDIGPVDVLLIPVGGHFTIDAGQATQVMQSLGPRITIPMHFKTPRVDFPIAGVDDFLAGKGNVRRPGGSETEVAADSLPAQPEVVALEPSL